MFRWLAVLLLLVPAVAAAELSNDEFTSFRDMHRDTEFGTWFLNVGAFRVSASRQTKRFREIAGNGEIEGLPKQRGYCFVLNNFDPERVGDRLTIDVTLAKRGDLPAATGSVARVEEKMRTINFSTTGDMVSRNPPDFCISSLTGVTSLEMSIDASDGAADRNYVLTLTE